MPRSILPFPQELRPRLPTIVGNVDYFTLRHRLEEIDVLLRVGCSVPRCFREAIPLGLRWNREIVAR